MAKVSKKLTGTTFLKDRNKWKAQARIDGKMKNLGNYDTQEDAYRAVVAAKPELLRENDEFTVPLTPAVKASIKKNRTKTQISQRNDFLDISLGLNVLEGKIFIMMLRCLHQHDKPENVKPIVIPLVDIMGNEELGGSQYQMLHGALDVLGALKIKPPVGDKAKDYDKINLVQRLTLDSGTGVIIGSFTPAALPYLIDLHGNFTLGEIADLMKIKKPNTFRFYWLIKKWWFRELPVTNKDIDFDELKELTTGIETYPNFSDYNRRVLTPSIEELNSLNDGNRFNVTYHENRNSDRSVKGVTFNIQYNDPELERKALKAAAKVIPIAQASTTTATVPESKPVWYLALNEKMKLGYKNMVEKDGIRPATARQIIEYVAADFDRRAKIFWDIRLAVQTDDSLKRQGIPRGAAVVKRCREAFKQDFK